MAKITVFGGSGYLGYHLIAKLAKEGHQIVNLTRQLNSQEDTRQFSNVKFYTYPKEDKALAELMRHSDYIINLIGTFDGNKKRSKVAHASYVERIAKLAKELKVKKIIHVSALGVSEDANSQYYKSKYEGERILEETLKNSFVQYAIVRPAFMFGKRAPLLDQLIHLVAVAPYMMIPSSRSKLQPVYVMDVVDGIVSLLEKQDLDRKIYNFAGKETLTFIELIKKALQCAHISPKKVGKMPNFFAWLMAKTTGWIPKAPFTMNHYLSMQVDGTTTKNDLPLLGVELQSLESVLTFEYSSGVYDRYDKDRQIARRDSMEIQG